MSYEKYCEVVDQLCKMIGHQHPRQFYETANITAYGASFSLMHGGAAAPDSLIVFCDFGPLPGPVNHVESFDAVLALLVANLQMTSTAERGTFSMNPASGHILFSSAVPLKGATAEAVMLVLEHYAGKLKAWKESLFGKTAKSNDAPTTAKASNASLAGQGRSKQTALLKKFSMEGK